MDRARPVRQDEETMMMRVPGSVSRTGLLAVVVVALTALAAGCAEQQHESGYGEPEAVVGPLPFLGVHGLAVGPDGRLLAGSVVGQSIAAVDRDTGAVDTVVGPPEGMADDLVFGPDGRLTWTSYLAGKLRMRGDDGDIRVLAKGLPGINALDYAEDGRLFATRVFLGDALYEIDPDGQAEPRRIKQGMGGLNGFEIGADGWLYGPLWFEGEIVRVDPASGEMETVARGFATPAAVNFDSRGRLYAVDAQTGELVRVDVDSGDRETVAELAPALDNLAIDGEDRVYVSNMADGAIHEVQPDDGAVREVVSQRLAAPSGLALAGGRLYVADVFAFRAVSPGSGGIEEIARMFADDLHYPTNAGSGHGRVVLSSRTTNVVQVYERDSGELLRTLEDFESPGDALPLGDGGLLVAEHGSGALVRVPAEDGGEREAVLDELDGPVGLARGDDGATFYVTTTGGRVWSVARGDWTEELLAWGLERPEGVDVAPDGRVMVMESGAGRILAVEPGDYHPRVVAEGLPTGLPDVPGPPPGGTFSDIAATEDGDLYYTADVEAGLYRLPPR